MNKKMTKLGEKTNSKEEEVKKLTKIGISGLLALILSVFTVGWSDSQAAEVKPQPEKDETKPLSERCRLKPVGGPCKAIFEKYYFDAGTNTCKTFFYGGCEGVVPFETQEACDKACVAQQTTVRPYPGHKYGGPALDDFKDAK
jgi:hypothetical protein